MNCSIQLKRRVDIAASLRRGVFILCCFSLCSTLHAVSPPPDGGYPGGNTAEGTSALFSLTSGAYNTALGFQALFNNTTGNYNTATGDHALYRNTTGPQNTAIGVSALFSLTTGANNTANGFEALFRDTTGSQNTATGSGALINNTVSGDNTANGFQALNGNTSGYQNTADGSTALASNTTGIQNTATGFEALSRNTTAGSNTADGFEALINNTGGNNIALGAQAGFHLTTGSNNIDIGNMGVAAETHTMRIGTTGAQTKVFVAGINGISVVGSRVAVSTSGQLGVVPSSQRFKTDIKPMDKASEAILTLKPVTFHYKQELDPKGVPQFGLVAEEVEKVNPDLVVRDVDGKPYSVRYEAVNAMLLNEFLKEHRKVENLESTVAKQDAAIAQQQKEIQTLTASLKAQASQIQKVNARFEVSKPALQTVLNNQ